MPSRHCATVATTGPAPERLPGPYKLWRKDVIAAIETTTAANMQGKQFNIWRTSR